MSLLERRQALDRLQQSRTAPAFAAAVIKKFGDDRAGNLAALIAYYAFVSLFPLLLVFVTILGFALQGDPSLKARILDGTLGKIPLLSDQLKLHSLPGSGSALAIGVVLTLLAGLGVTGASQTAFNRIWAVPFSKQPNFLTSRLRGIAALVALGVMMILSTLAGGFVGASENASGGAWALAAGVVLSLLVNVILFVSTFKLLTAIALGWRDVLPGVVLAAALWTLLQYFGGLYISHELKSNGPLYGSFALVLGLLAWLYLGAQLMLLSAEVNVVLARRLWPRSLFAPGLLDADRRAMRAAVRAQNRNVGERIEVHFEEPKEGSEQDLEPTESDLEPTEKATQATSVDRSPEP